ncbi:hypothetical protein ACMFMG_005147 [Clarireedia jacksonii]
MIQAVSRRTLKAFFEWMLNQRREGREEACRHQVGQHARDILEGIPARTRTGDWEEDQGEDETSYASGP